MKMGANQDIFPHRQPDKWLHNLEGSGDAASCETMWRLTGNNFARVADNTVVRPDEPGNNRKERGLARAIRANERGDAPLAGRERCRIDSQQAAKTTSDALDRQQRFNHAVPLPWMGQPVRVAATTRCADARVRRS